MSVEADTALRAKRVIQGMASDYALLGISVLVGLILTPWLVRALGRAEYGLWVTIGSTLGYIGLLDVGLSNAVPRFVAYHRTREGRDGANTVVASSLVLYSVVALCIMVAALLLSRRFDLLIDLEQIPLNEAALVLMIAASSLAIRLLMNPLRGAIFGYERLDKVNVAQSAFFLIRGGLTILVLVLGMRLIAVASADLIATVVLGGILLYFFKKHLPSLSLGIRSFCTSMARDLLTYSGFVVVTAVSMQVILSSDNLIIGRFLGVSAVAGYAIAFSLIELSRQAVLRVGRSLVPLYASENAQSGRDLSRRMFLEASSLSVGLGMSLFILLFLLGGDFIVAWVGHDNFVGWTILRVLCTFVLIQSIVVPGQVALLSLDRHRAVSALRSVEAGLKLLLALSLVKVWGALGVATGTVLSGFLTTMWAIPFVTSRELQLPIGEYLQRVIMPHAAIGLPMLALGLVGRSWWSPTGLLQLVVSGAAILLVYVSLYWFVFVDNTQRAFYFRMVATLFSRGR